MNSTNNRTLIRNDMDNGVIDHNLLHDSTNAGTGIVRAIQTTDGGTDTDNDTDILDNIIHTIENDCIELVTGSGSGYVYNVDNNSLYNCGGLGIDLTGTTGTHVAKNNTSIGNGGGDYDTGFDTFTTNGSGDTTGDPVGLEGLVSTTEWVSVTAGSEDLHLKSGATSIDACTDLVTTPSLVQFDIDNYDRDAGGVTWDCGADELTASSRNRFRMIN